MLRHWVGVGWTPRRTVLWRSQVEPWKTVWQCELEKKTRRVFRNKFPVIYRLSFYKHFKIPGNFQPILGHEPIVSLRRKRHFFQKPSKRWRGFPPGGKFKYSGIAINSMLCMCVFVCVCIPSRLGSAICGSTLCIFGWPEKWSNRNSSDETWLGRCSNA